MYFASLDILRFLSSVSVFFHHTFSFDYGKLGVYLFFIISGFVIYFSLNKSLKDYALGRFIRLYPVFWVCCSLTFLVTLVYGVNPPISRYFLDMLMFNDGKIAQMVDGSYWTLTFELLFYFYVGVFVWFFGTKRLEWFYILWLAISFLAFFLKIDQHIVMKLLCVRFVPYFVFGGMLALCIDRFKSSDTANRFMYGSILLMSASMPIFVSDALRAQRGVISNMTGSFEPDELKIVVSFFVVMPAVLFLSYWSRMKGKKFIKVCQVLGGVTYPLYLLHWKIGDTLITHYGSTYGTITKVSVLVAILIFSTAYIFSVYDVRVRKYLKEKLLMSNV